MRTLGLLITLLAVSPQMAAEQKPAVPEGTSITSAQVTGVDIDRLSPGLRTEIRAIRHPDARARPSAFAPVVNSSRAPVHS